MVESSPLAWEAIIVANDLNLVRHLTVLGSDPERLYRSTARLRSELRDLPVANVGPVVSNSSPAGAKSGAETRYTFTGSRGEALLLRAVALLHAKAIVSAIDKALRQS
jgi:hypothetical protein